MQTLEAVDALALRMRALLLSGTPAGSPAEVVRWFGAMQAQDVASGHWSFGVRVPGLTDADVDAATENRQVVRTWPMRGTIHFVPPADVRWMLELTGVRALNGLAARWERLGLDQHQLAKAADVLGTGLADGQPRTRSECIDILNAAGLDATGQRAYHLLWHTAQIGVTVIGPQRAGQQTFALLDAWLPEQNTPDRDEALATMALRYFRSHGPASKRDFTGWTGLTATDIRTALGAAGDALTAVSVGGVDMFCTAEALHEQRPDAAPLTVLPGFDEYLLGYKDRTLMADPDVMAAVIPGGNGIFRSTVTTAGRVRATWTRKTRKRAVDVTLQPLDAWRPELHREALTAGFAAYGQFLGLAASVVNVP